MFEENTRKLWNFASTNNPFECKDIKIALTEIRELQNHIDEMEITQSNNLAQIATLTEEKYRLNRTLYKVSYSKSQSLLLWAITREL